MVKHLFLLGAAISVLAACGPADEDWFTQGDTVTGPAIVEKKAREKVAGKVDVEKVDVIIERERQMGSRAPVVVGYTAYVKGKGCSGSMVLYYDETGVLKREDNSMKC